MTTPDFPDFRALAQELVETWDATADFDFNDFGHAAAEIVDRARIELATPPRELPDHVNLIGFAFGREPWATWLQQGGCLESAHRELSDLMLAVLAHWGRPATPPTEPPTDEDLWAFWNNHDGPIPAILRAALERWGR